MIRIYGRSSAVIAKALIQPRHYRALINSFWIYKQPFSGLFRYITGKGCYPCKFSLRTPIGEVTPTLFTKHDMLTVNEIFCRLDYQCRKPKIVVDLGSNIGLSAIYFLSRDRDTFCYLFEPLPLNIQRLTENLQAFEQRFKLESCAVGLENGTVSFGFEKTGRYGGIGCDTGASIDVPCRNVQNVLGEVLSKHDYIDVLKVDIESLEKEIVEAIPTEMKTRINTIMVEQHYRCNPFRKTHILRQYGAVAHFKTKRLAGC